MQLYSNTDRAMEQLGYARIIGRLTYAMTCTKKDIMYVVGKMNRHTDNLIHIHWNVIHTILKYLKGTINYGIHYNDYPTAIEGYTDAN